MDLNPRLPKQTRVVVYIPESDHQQLKDVLAQTGQSVSGWVRLRIRKYLAGIDKQP